MKNILLYFTLVFILSSCSNSVTKNLSTINYETSRDEGHIGNHKILKGTINRTIFLNDTAFNWYAENYKYANPDASAIEAFSKNKDKFKLLVFVGTWCEDSRNLIPLFYKLVDKSNFNENNIYLIGVDRSKVALNNLHKKFNVTLIPTFIVLHKGKEIGRVVEYGRSGMIDKELGTIVNTIK